MNSQDAKTLLAESEVLFTAEQVNAATARVARELNRDYDRFALTYGPSKTFFVL